MVRRRRMRKGFIILFGDADGRDVEFMGWKEAAKLIEDGLRRRPAEEGDVRFGRFDEGGTSWGRARLRRDY